LKHIEQCTLIAAVLMQWHSPDKEGSNEKSLRELLEACDFSLVRELRPRRELQLDGGWYSTGVQLYRHVSHDEELCGYSCLMRLFFAGVWKHFV
jgi:hypothetical protein